MNYTIPELVSLIYDLERSRHFRSLRRELARRYRRYRSPEFHREAYVDSILTLLFESELDPQSLVVGR